MAASNSPLGILTGDIFGLGTDLDDGNGNGVVPWWAALQSYLVSTYPTDTQLQQFIATGNSVVPQIQQDIQALTTDPVQPPKTSQSGILQPPAKP